MKKVKVLFAVSLLSLLLYGCGKTASGYLDDIEAQVEKIEDLYEKVIAGSVTSEDASHEYLQISIRLVTLLQDAEKYADEMDEERANRLIKLGLRIEELAKKFE